MSKPPAAQPPIPKKDTKPDEDLTGRTRLVSNVAFSWTAHFVFIIAGFILPRLIDRSLGQELLGVWDFAWALVSYFGLVQGGICSSVNRYVARYRAAGNVAGVNRTVSSASCILGVSGLVALGVTTVASLLLPQLFGPRLGENIVDAQWAVFFLGSRLALEISLGAFVGLLTGYHHWKLHNIIKSGWHAAAVAGMILALILGGSLPSLAVIMFVGVALAGLTQVIMAYRVCEGLQVRPSLVGWVTIRELLLFGGKTLMPSVSRLLLNQTISVTIVAHLGPAALALYSRPWSLIRHMDTLVHKMAMTLSPATSSLESIGRMKEIQQLLVKSVRYALYMVLPMILVLMVFGGSIMEFWMGPRYGNSLIPAILGVGYLATMVQTPALMILMGMNAHGRAGMATFVASLCSVGLTVIALGPLGLGVVAAAVATTLPLTIMNLVYVPFLICRRVELSVGEYLLSVARRPVVCVMPFAISLVAARLIFQNKQLMGLIIGGTAGGAILVIQYWRYVLPIRIKMRVLRVTTMRGVAKCD